jgi:hypothetical protein
MPADLKRLHKYMLDVEHIGIISDEMREVFEELWPELVHRPNRRVPGSHLSWWRSKSRAGPQPSGPSIAVTDLHRADRAQRSYARAVKRSRAIILFRYNVAVFRRRALDRPFRSRPRKGPSGNPATRSGPQLCRIASHGVRVPRLTLKAGRRAGYKAGCRCKEITVAQRTSRPFVR